MNMAKIRDMRGLSQRQLAELIDMDQATIQRAEKMHSTAKLTTYRKIAEALRVSLADLFADDRSRIELDLLNVFRRIPPSKHEELLRLLRLAQVETRKDTQ